MNRMCCSIPEVKGGKVGKLAAHLKDVCKNLEKTCIVCEEDLENKSPSWDLHHPPSDVEETTLTFLMLRTKWMDTCQKIRSCGKWCLKT